LTSFAVPKQSDFKLLETELGPREPAFGTPLRRLDLVVVAIVFAGSCAAVAVVATGGVATNPTAFAAVLVANIVTLALGGLLWLHGRPSSSFGYLLLAQGLLVLVSSLAGSSVPALYLIGNLGVWATGLGITWLLLAFPGVRPRGDAAWLVMSIAVFAVAFGELPLLLVSGAVPTLPVVGHCVHACPANPVLVADSPAAAHALRYVEASFQALWGIGMLAFLATQFAGASYPRRRLVAPVFVAATPFLAAFTVNAFFAGLLDLQSGVGAQAIFVGTRIVLPLGFIAALLFARVYAGEALALMAGRLVGRPSAAAVEQLVRRVLDDPQARLVFWLPRRERFVDRHGRRVSLDPASNGKTWRAFGHGDAHLLAIVHDAVLGDDSELVEAVGATALLALENRRLEQDLIDSVDALRASQRRLVAAASTERRKIERDLHDGVQQKLVALRIQLELARDLADEGSGVASRLAGLGAGFDDALDELRSVAHGIYPPLLADEGLVAAFREAARWSTVPLTVDLEDVGRLSEEREAAIYYCCLEALQNVAKHAGDDASASLRLWRDRRTVHFSVSDDGVGFEVGSNGRGAGLTNMSDRIGAVGGTLAVRSAPGEGTTVEGRISVEPTDRTDHDGVHV
jgi:signal transduction histidine kinase